MLSVTSHQGEEDQNNTMWRLTQVRTAVSMDTRDKRLRALLLGESCCRHAAVAPRALGKLKLEWPRKRKVSRSVVSNSLRPRGL